MASFQAYNKLIISEEDGLKLYRCGDAVLGYEFKCQYPSYRGTYLSCIEGFEVVVDGKKVPDDSVFILLNGKSFLISQLADLYMEYWYILDKATIRVIDLNGLSAGEHAITVNIRHRIPYTGYGGNHLVLDGTNTKVMTIEA